VGTVRIHHGDLPVRFSISHQLPSQDALGEGLILQLPARAQNRYQEAVIGGKRLALEVNTFTDDFACIAIPRVRGKLRPAPFAQIGFEQLPRYSSAFGECR